MRKLILILAVSLLVLITGCAQNTKQAESNSANNQVTDSSDDTNYPEQPIKFVIPFPPGGNSDLIGRILAEGLEEEIGESVVIENTESGAGALGLVQIFDAEPDGYTIGLAVNHHLSHTPHRGDVPYSYDSFQPILRTVSGPQMLVVRKDAPWDTFDEWLEYVKENPNKFSYGMTGIGTSQHTAMVELNQSADIKTKAVPYAGTGDAVKGVLSGDTDAVITYPASLDQSQIKILFNFGEESPERFSDVPTLKESGIDVAQNTNYGIVAPKELDEEKLEFLHEAFRRVLESPEITEKFVEELGFGIAYQDFEDFQATLKAEFENNEGLFESIDLDN